MVLTNKAIIAYALIVTFSVVLLSSTVMADDDYELKLRHKSSQDESLVWYRLEAGSRIDMVDGGQTRLSGYIALQQTTAVLRRRGSENKLFFSIPLTKLDQTPEVIRVKKRLQYIPLFGGPGVGIGATFGSMAVTLDGNICSFQWFLRHKLVRENYEEATIYRRDLVIDPDQSSIASFTGEDDIYPAQIDLFLVVEDDWSIYKPETIASPA